MPQGKQITLPDPLPKLLTVPELALLLRIKEQAVYDMVSQRRIPYLKAGGRLRFDRDAIFVWMQPEAAYVHNQT
jgi:excisionase family DNA binding protein